MKRVFTECEQGLKENLKGKTNDSRRKDMEGPSGDTLEYLFRLARSYRAEPALDAGLCGFVMN